MNIEQLSIARQEQLWRHFCLGATLAKALDKIYQIYIPLHLSDLQNSTHFRHESVYFFHYFNCKRLTLSSIYKKIFCFSIFVAILAETKFWRNFTDFFSDCPENADKILMPKIGGKSRKNWTRVRVEFQLS